MSSTSPRSRSRTTVLGRESYDDIMDPAGYRQVAVLGVDGIWVRRSVLSQDPQG